MKIKVNKNAPKFESIKLKITIESEEELCNLWHRINAAGVIFNKEYGSLNDVKHGVMASHELWEVLNKLAIENNLKK